MAVALTAPSGLPDASGSKPPRGARRPHGWLTRNLRVVSAVSFLQDTASELLYPVLPIFMTTVLGAPPGVVGMVEGVAEGASSVTKVVAGRAADLVGRRPLIAAGYGLAAVGKIIIALAGTWPMVLMARCVDRFGKGLRGAPRDALIAADVPEAARGRAFGFHRGLDTAGAVVGPLLGLWIYLALGGRIRPLLVIAVIPAVLSAALVAALRDPAGSPTRSDGGSPLDAGAPLDAGSPSDAGSPLDAGSPRGTRELPTRYWRVVAVLTLFSLINFPDALLLLRLAEIGFSVSAVILAYVTYNAVYALLSFPAGVLADRLPRARVFGLGLVFFAVGYTGLGLTTSHTVAWLLLAAYGGFTAFTDGVGKAWISALVPAGTQGAAQGYSQGLAGAGVLVAGIWAGLAWGADGRLPLLVSGLAATVIAVALLTVPGSALAAPR